MYCPTCGFLDTKVLESRLTDEGRTMRRRRVCLSCNYRFTTYEKEEEVILQVQKKDGRFEEFSREKLIRAIATACRKRGIPIIQVESLVQGIEQAFKTGGERIVHSKKIGDLVMQKLKELDHVAYVRFASIYKEFKSAEEFVAELQNLEDPAKKSRKGASRECSQDL
jgi:transcriptional repressor NrdR